MTYFGAGVAWTPAWSPKGERVTFVASDTGNDEIWIIERDGWPARQLTQNEWEWDHHPSFSPDGSQIVFASNRDTGRRQIWMMEANGENQRQITSFTFEAWDPVWVKYTDQ
jgi:TolB protein